MVPPIWSLSTAVVAVGEGACVAVDVASDDEEVVPDVEDALSGFDEVKPAPKPTASPIASTAATRMAQNIVGLIPQILRLLAGFWGSDSDQSKGTSGA